MSVSMCNSHLCSMKQGTYPVEHVTLRSPAWRPPEKGNKEVSFHVNRLAHTAFVVTTVKCKMSLGVK